MPTTTTPNPKNLGIGQVDGRWSILDRNTGTVVESFDTRAQARTALGDIKSGDRDITPARVDEPTPAPAMVGGTRLERVQLAKVELAAVKAWSEGGEVGPKPATPNDDALKATAATSTSSKARKSTVKGKANGAPSGPRGAGDDDVAAWVLAQLNADHTLSRAAALKAFRATGKSCSQQRFGKTFDEVRAAHPVAVS